MGIFRGRRVGDDGPRTARVVLIGEAPGEQEVKSGRPFVGAAGHRLREWMGDIGLRREEVYITNTFPYRPPGNKLEAVPREERAVEVAALHDRIAALEDPRLLVPMGNAALEAITGKGSITKYRGSILAYTDRRGRQIKVVPTIHPAATFRQPGLERACRHDWARVAAEAAYPEMWLPVRDHQIAPTLQDVRHFLAQREAAYLDGHREILAVDIENPKNEMVCIGFSVDPRWRDR